MFAELADVEIDKLKKYYDGLSTIQKLFFPGKLKLALRNYSNYKANGRQVYEALFSSSLVLKKWPFFAFLSQFSTSVENPVASACCVAHGLYGLEDEKFPTKFNNYENEIVYLIQYKNGLSWFGKMFFPKKLSAALESYNQNKDLYSLYDVLSNNHNTWLFPKINLFAKTPLLQAYMEFKKLPNTKLDEDNKKNLFQIIATSDYPLKIVKAVKIDNVTYNIFKQTRIEAYTAWVKKYPELEEDYLVKLGDNASDATIRALLNIKDIDKRLEAFLGLMRLPENLSNDEACISLVINHDCPFNAASTMRFFHEKKFFEIDKDLCLDTARNDPEAFYDSTFPFELILNKAGLDDKQKISILKHANKIFHPLISTLWKVVPASLFLEVILETISICERNAENDTNKIIGLFMNIKEVFDYVNKQCLGAYDVFTAKLIDNELKMIDDESKSVENQELLYTFLPHLIRRNTSEANKIIEKLLKMPVIRKKVSNLELHNSNTVTDTQLTIRQILSCAINYNKTIHNSIMKIRLGECVLNTELIEDETIMNQDNSLSLSNRTFA